MNEITDLITYLKKHTKKNDVEEQKQHTHNFSPTIRNKKQTGSENMPQIGGVKQTVSKNFADKTNNRDENKDNVVGKTKMYQLEFVPERILKGFVIALLMLKGYNVYEEKQFSLQRIDVYAEKGDEKLVIEIESSKKTYREGLRQLSHVYAELRDNAEYILVLPSASKKVFEDAEKLGFKVWTIVDLVKEMKNLGIEDHNYVQILELNKMNIRDYILKTPEDKALTEKQKLFKDYLVKLISRLNKGIWIRKVEQCKSTIRRGNKTYQYIRKRVSIPPDFPHKYAVIMRAEDFIDVIEFLSELVGLPIDKEKLRELFNM